MKMNSCASEHWSTSFASLRFDAAGLGTNEPNAGTHA